MSTPLELGNTLVPFAGMPLKRRSLDMLDRIRMFDLKMYFNNNPHDSGTEGSISGLSTKGASLFLRCYTGMRIN
jgi:hypothetical protein